MYILNEDTTESNLNYFKEDYSEKYDPPYNAEQIKQNYGVELYKKLANDPVHKWRMETGIELIHKEPTKKEFDRIWQNWNLMTDEQKKLSDKKSIELFGVSNQEHYKKLVGSYLSGEDKALTEVYPNKGESKEDFISRFMSATKDEYPDQKQRLAVAYSYWDKRKLKEEFLIDDSKIYTTQSPYEIKNKLIGSEIFYRIAYDKLLDRYFICDAYSEESLHISMIMKASELGYYNKKMSYNEAYRYMAKNVDCYRTVPKSSIEEVRLGAEGFMDAYEYDNFIIGLRDMSFYGGQKTDFTTTELYKVLGKYNSHSQARQVNFYHPVNIKNCRVVEKYLKEEFIAVETRPFELEDILYWYNPEDGTCSAIIDYKKKKTRVRAGLLIIKNNKVLLCKNGAHFDLPGGSIEMGETIEEAAKREAQEEVNITAKNIRETGFDYCTTNDELEDWVAENVPEKYQWYNYYTCLCIGDYSSEFKGKVDAIDKDPEMKNSADWYDIDTIVDNPEFLEPWRNALTKFGYYNKTLTEGLKDLAKDYFGEASNWKTCFYINTDGTLLDGSGKLFGSSGKSRTIDHREIADIFDDTSGNDAMLAYMKEGNIRFKPEAPGFEMLIEPTEAQYKKIKSLVNSFYDSYYLDFSNQYGEVIKSNEYTSRDGLQIIDDIKDYFNKSLNEDTQAEENPFNLYFPEI